MLFVPVWGDGYIAEVWYVHLALYQLRGRYATFFVTKKLNTIVRCGIWLDRTLCMTFLRYPFSSFLVLLPTYSSLLNVLITDGGVVHLKVAHVQISFYWW